MEHEIVVEGFVLQVEVNVLADDPPCPESWNSDWDAQGERELEFKLVSGRCYDDDGIPMDVPGHQLPVLAHQLYTPIVIALWVEIDALKRRERRWAA
ncbi:hypothetical protein IB241_15795 [Pseudomonas sp. PDM05]|uniref:hypothetical protein n=1 Tax=Pseudomonas sp. PDM05 TaxID=2769301 RepID=UPI00178753C3|nr:hypothetical protein [Pseudomonas sp. PDM05]MBD9459145.1 hypothetical protein [Pseudomonas sp. PDM05]